MLFFNKLQNQASKIIKRVKDGFKIFACLILKFVQKTEETIDFANLSR